MKTFARFVFVVTATMPFSLREQSFAQIENYCGFDPSLQAPLTQTGGEHITSSGTVKALLIFIDFPDDAEDPYNPTWPVGIGPNYLSQIVDETETQNSGLKNNITTFFRRMSFNQFTMIGKAYYQQAPQPLSWYQLNHPGDEAAYAAKDAIQILDGSVDFSDFDRWISNGAFNHTPGQDGKLDMVFICYRRWYICVQPSNFCSSFLAEGWYGASLPGDVYVDKNRRRIISSQAVDVLRMIQYPRLEHLLHEFGHVWGLPHNYSGGLWSLMSHRNDNVSSFMNSYEREQLGWINFNNVTVDGTTATVSDFATTGVTYRIAIPNTNPQEYFLFENHQQISLYDTVDISSATGPGLYILQDNGNRDVEANNLRVVAADGRWNWSNPYWTHNPYSPNPLDSLPVYKRELINRAQGRTDKVLIPHTKGGSNYVITWLDEQTGQLKNDFRYKGDGKDHFTFTDNNMFSPWSGYAAYNWSGSTATTIGVQITGTSGTNINVKFYTTSPVNGPPSKPVDPRLSSNSGQYGNIRFSWAANVEPDLSSYEVSRKVQEYGNVWSVVATTTNNYWVDPEYFYAPGAGDFHPTYKVRAKDTQNLFSSYSDSTTVRAESNKRGTRDSEIAAFALEQNYPNPFNPTTNIHFQIPNDGHVRLKVFNMLGQEVATLVDEVQSAGTYSVPFDALQLASGVYIYTLKSGNFVASKKLLLMK